MGLSKFFSQFFLSLAWNLQYNAPRFGSNVANVGKITLL